MVIAIIGNFLISYGIYYAAISSVYSLIMVYDAERNSPYYVDTADVNGIIAFMCISYFANFIQTLFFGCFFSIHAFGINLAIHKYIYFYLYYVLTIIENTGCEHRRFLNCTEQNSNTYEMDNAILIKSREYILYGIGVLVFFEFLTGFIDRNKRYFFSKRFHYELLYSFLFINCVAITYCSVFLIIICPICAQICKPEDDTNHESCITQTNQINLDRIFTGSSHDNCPSITTQTIPVTAQVLNV